MSEERVKPTHVKRERPVPFWTVQQMTQSANLGKIEISQIPLTRLDDKAVVSIAQGSSTVRVDVDVLEKLITALRSAAEWTDDQTR